MNRVERPLRILLVESALEQAEMVALELLRAGFDAEWCVADEPGTFRARLADGPDLVLSELDCAPGLDLAEVIRCARASVPPPPVVAVSVSEEERLGEACRRLGASGWVSKRRLQALPEEARRVLGARAPEGAEPAATREPEAPAPLRVSARELAERLPDWLLELGADGRVLYANPSARRALGLAAAPAPRCRFAERLHPEDREAALGALREALAGRESRAASVRVRGAEGPWRDLVASVSPYATPEGEPRAVVLARPAAAAEPPAPEPGRG